jgi:kynureninase
LHQVGVITDFRAPDRLRIAPMAAYTRFSEVWDAMDRLRALVDQGQHLEVSAARGRLT